jgi:hypothetical protein
MGVLGLQEIQGLLGVLGLLTIGINKYTEYTRTPWSSKPGRHSVGNRDLADRCMSWNNCSNLLQMQHLSRGLVKKDMPAKNHEPWSERSDAGSLNPDAFPGAASQKTISVTF